MSWWQIVLVIAYALATVWAMLVFGFRSGVILMLLLIPMLIFFGYTTFEVLCHLIYLAARHGATI